MTEEDYTSLLPPGTSVHVLCTPAENVVEALSRVADSMGAKTELPAEVYAPLAPPGLPDNPEKPLTAASIGQVIPTFTCFRPFLAHFSPFFPRFLRVFTASARRFQRAASRSPGPRDSGKGAQTPF